MKKNYTKLTNEDLRNIAKRYASTEDTLSMIALDYNCSTSKISNAIKKSILLGITDLKMAGKIKIKADFNANVKILEKRLFK